MANQSKNENRGGKRAGAGRKPGREPLSVRQLQEFERAAAAKAKETHVTLQDIVLNIAYDPDSSNRDKLAAAKLYWDKSIILASEGSEADEIVGPAIYLPEQRPVLKIVEKDKKKDKK